VLYANWASARIGGEISYILLSEVMGDYKAYLFDTDAIFSSHVINYAAGWRDGDDISVGMATTSVCCDNQWNGPVCM
jgi:hypothetical protein